MENKTNVGVMESPKIGGATFEKGFESDFGSLAAENTKMETRIEVRSDYLNNLEHTFTGTSGFEESPTENFENKTMTATNNPEKVEQAQEAEQPESRGFNGKMTDYLTSYDPENLLGSLRKMNEAELDNFILEIEKGDLDSVKSSLEKPEEKREEPIMQTEQLQEVSIAIDRQRYAQLKEILSVDPEEEVSLEQVSTEQISPVVEQKIEKVETTDTLSANVLAQKSETVAQPEVETAVSESEAVKIFSEAPMTSIADIPKNPSEYEDFGHKERMIDEKIGGTVIYDLREEMKMLAEVPIILVENKITHVWSLPETHLYDDSDEKNEIADNIEKRSDIEVEMKDEVERKKESFSSDSGDKYENEAVYFSSHADSTEPIKEDSNFKWLTFREIADQKLELDEHSMELIMKVAEQIKKEIEEREKAIS